MAAIQLQLEMSRGLWAGRQPSSGRNTTSETGWEKSIHLVERHRRPGYRGGKRQTKADIQTYTQTDGRTEREARQMHRDIDTGRQTER